MLNAAATISHILLLLLSIIQCALCVCTESDAAVGEFNEMVVCMKIRHFKLASLRDEVYNDVLDRKYWCS